ncbi:MAG: septum formation protein Maf [Chloroflexi bacterium]|nr:septum formation protein Maf [Chloroflexota bacterium]
MPEVLLVLASASPRRRAILSLLGLPFEVRPAEVPEQALPGESPEMTAERLAQEKAEAVARTLKSGIVVAADTVVILDGEALGKPRDARDARAMLRRLRGRWHTVTTGVAVVDAATRRRASTTRATRVLMRDYSPEEVERSISSGEPLDKAGAYAIQDPTFAPVARIEGCYLNVVGLPLCATEALLESIGVRARTTWPVGVAGCDCIACPLHCSVV